MKASKKSPPLTLVYGLPHSILTYVKKHYPEGTIINMEEDKNKLGELKYFEAEVVEGDNTYYIRFDKKGKFIYEETELGKIDSTEQSDELDTETPSATDEFIEEF